MENLSEYLELELECGWVIGVTITAIEATVCDIVMRYGDGTTRYSTQYMTFYSAVEFFKDLGYK